MDTTRSAADEAKAAAKAEAAVKAAKAQRKLVALVVFEKKEKPNKHQWQPLHGSDDPEGYF
jgi:hypothetical protein